MRLLLDEHISPSLVRRLAAIDVFALSVPHAGLGGKPDLAVWQYAFAHDLSVVTANARDFIALLQSGLHPGLIVLRESGLTADEQWQYLEPVVHHVVAAKDPSFMVNRLIEIWSIGAFRIRTMPPG